jgi:hypothetical protein
MKELDIEIDMTDTAWPENYEQVKAALERDCHKREAEHEAPKNRNAKRRTGNRRGPSRYSLLQVCKMRQENDTLF